MATYGGSNIVLNGLILNLDAGNPKSFSSGSNLWKDLSGNGYNFIGTGSYTASNGAIIFNRNNVSNTGGIFTLSNIPNALKIENFLSSSFTIEIWVSPQTYSGSNTDATETVASMITWPGNHNFVGTNSTSIYNASIWNSGPSATFDLITSSSLALPSTSSFNQIVTVVDKAATSSIAYKNGTLVYSTGSVPINTMTSANGNPANTLSIGGARNSGNYRWFYSGSMAIVKLYNRALSASEVSQNYNAIKSRFNL